MPQQILGDFLARRGIAYLDLLDPIRTRALRTPGRRFYKTGNTHFNVAGNQVAGTELAQFLKDMWGR